MKCITSPALENIEIAKYVDGEADEAVVAHIKECPFCREKAGRWTLMQNRLKKQLYRVSCPSPIELGDFHLRLLPPPQMLVVAQHVRECPLCRREVAELEDFLDAPVLENQLLKAAKVLFARLTGAPQAIPVLRGETRGPLTFEADGVVIMLDIQQTNDGKINILGQLAADDQDQWTASMVELQQADSPPLTVTLDDLGTFRFEELRLGSTQITITPPSGIIVQIPNFDIAF